MVSTTIAVRTAVPHDIPVLREVYRRSALANAGDRANLLAHPDTLVFAGESVDKGWTRVALLDNRIVGFATLIVARSIGELDDLFVEPDWMRRGIGRMLVLDAVSAADARGLTRIDVTANPHAQGFYGKLGFVLDGSTLTAFGAAQRWHLSVPVSARGRP